MESNLAKSSKDSVPPKDIFALSGEEKKKFLAEFQIVALPKDEATAKKHFAECHPFVKEHIGAFIEVGKRLQRIRDEGLFLPQIAGSQIGATSFSAYLKNTYTHYQRAQQLLYAADTRQILMVALKISDVDKLFVCEYHFNAISTEVKKLCTDGELTEQGRTVQSEIGKLDKSLTGEKKREAIESIISQIVNPAVDFSKADASKRTEHIKSVIEAIPRTVQRMVSELVSDLGKITEAEKQTIETSIKEVLNTDVKLVSPSDLKAERKQVKDAKEKADKVIKDKERAQRKADKAAKKTKAEGIAKRKAARAAKKKGKDEAKTPKVAKNANEAKKATPKTQSLPPKK